MPSARASQAQTFSSHSSSASLAKLIEKKKEFDAVSALERASSIYLQRIEALGDDFDVMANAGEVHGQVLEQWPRMFQILSLFLSSRANSTDDMSENAQPEHNVDGQKLVRLPVEDLQRASTSTS
ncbi:hypothetical protein BDQ17DRAFT_1430354 [Cyathus striatus]|nr:hypothetical protein BDQ17DRAFT_1430354 [Cyathus striatus]